MLQCKRQRNPLNFPLSAVEVQATFLSEKRENKGKPITPCRHGHTFLGNLGSLEIRVSTYISAKLKKRTYMYDSLQFPVEMNTRGSKTDNFYSFSHEV